MKKFISIFTILFVVWIALAGFSIPEMLLGAVVSVLLSLIIGQTVIYSLDANIFSSILKFIFLYVPVLIVKLIQSNLSMAKIILSPSLPIHPGFVKIHTSLNGDVAKFALANSITLTPGTITVDVTGSELLIHCADVKGENEKEYFDNIAKDFEKVLGGIFK